MNSEDITDLDPVPFDLAKRIWVESGVLPVSLSGANFGGTLALLYEASRLSEAFGIPKILVTSAGTQTWLHSLAKKFECSPRAHWPRYPTDLSVLSNFQAHSTLRLMKYPELLSSRSEKSIWCDTVIEETSRFLGSIVNSQAVLFASKFQSGKRRLGDFPHEQWSPILRRLVQTHKVLVLGSNPTRESFANLDVVFLADLLSLPAQAELASSQTIPLIGDASGFFSAAIWHRGAYLCFKDPNYDETEMREEHAGENHLHVGSGDQYLIRKQPTLEAVHDFLRRAKYGE